MITLKTLPQATEQEVFDQAVTHLLTQMEVSQDTNGKCLYRGPGMLKCAGGCFISDEEYTGSMEGRLWGGLVEDDGISKEHSLLIEMLQGIHDNRLPDNWERELKALAKDRNLKFNWKP